MYRQHPPIFLLTLFILCLYIFILYIFLFVQNHFTLLCKILFSKRSKIYSNHLAFARLLMMMHALNVYENMPRKNMEHKRFRFSYYNGVVIIATNLSFRFLEHLNLEMFSNIIWRGIKSIDCWFAAEEDAFLI